MTSRSGPFPTTAELAIAAIYRSDWGRLLAVLVARTRRLDLAEDALGEAFARAADRWPRDGVPANPAGWLYTTAQRHLVGRLRAEAVAGRKQPLLAIRPGWVAPPDDAEEELRDERLQLILLCCHPALPIDSRAALALRLVIGTPTEQIARLFLVSQPTMAARLTRAKKKIVAAGIPLGTPLAEELRSRLDEVTRTIYLAFTAGYAPGSGPDLVRTDVAGDAVQLAATLHAVTDEAAQATALYALLLLQHSRRDARVRDGQLVRLDDQDRSLWHQDEIDAGLALVDGLRPGDGYAEELRLQALIAAEHARGRDGRSPDWEAIARHYAALEAITASPVVRINRAVAVAETSGPAAGLELLRDLDDVIGHSHRLAAVRADLARRAGQFDLARASYRAAIALGPNDVERDFLVARLASLPPSSTGER
jgi:RNA polymerase sigma-70 factor (ECF subfamily)